LASGGEKEKLGRQLFFDKRLSANDSISCATCHRPDRAFTDGARVSRGIDGKLGERNAPTVLNLAKAKRLLWDGSAASLEKQAEGPLFNPAEMGNTRGALEEKLNSIPSYRTRFARAFGDAEITLPRITRALAAYERSLRSEFSLYSEWQRGRRERWTVEHEYGRQLFIGRAGCASCHSGPNFTSEELLPGDYGTLFKVPSLRELQRTAPYFHDGRYATLDDVLAHHAGGPSLDENARRALLAFLLSLSGDYSR
jgi:cytochrome c peroxidase